MLECYLCNTSLKDIAEHENEWTFCNIDGANVPLCWESSNIRKWIM